MNTRKNCFFHSFSLSTSRFYEERKAHSSWGPREINFYDPQPPKTRSYAEKSTSRWIWLYQKDCIVTIQQLTLVLGRRARKGAVPLFFLTHRPPPTANSITSMPRQRWVPNRGKQTAAPLSLDRGTGRERSFYIEKAHSARRFPLKDIACVLFAQTKDAKIVCIIAVGLDFSTHNLKRLASARHLIERKLYSCQIARFKQTSQWRRKSWWCILPAALILWHAGSDVMGCRRPTGGVFKYVSSDTSHAEAFPVATPRGRSSSSHGGELTISIFYLLKIWFLYMYEVEWWHISKKCCSTNVWFEICIEYWASPLKKMTIRFFYLLQMRSL